MKNLLLLLLLIIIASCGKKTETIVGMSGKDGQNCYAETRQDGNYVVCSDSEFKVENGRDGRDGRDGQDGQDGRDGQDGQDGQDGRDGRDGQDGQDGQDGTFNGYLEYVQICPQIAGSYKEVLIKLNSQYLAFLANGNYRRERLVVLNENTLYTTTDGRNVSFNIVGGDINCF